MLQEEMNFEKGVAKRPDPSTGIRLSDEHIRMLNRMVWAQGEQEGRIINRSEMIRRLIENGHAALFGDVAAKEQPVWL